MDTEIEGNILIPKVFKDFIITDEGKEVVLENKFPISIRRIKKLSIRWYKNGEVITPSDNIKIYAEDTWHRLEIKRVTKEDEGIYSLILNSKTFNGSTKYTVYVKSYFYENITYTFPNVFEGIVKPNVVRSCNLGKGVDHTLHVSFNEDIDRFSWFKNNKHKPTIYPTLHLKLNDSSTISLIFNNIKERDTGMYTLVALTSDKKFLCNFIEVIAGSKEIFDIYSKPMPYVWESPPFIEVYEKDDVRFIFKVSYDADTAVEWVRNGKEVKESNRIKVDKFGLQYIVLKLYNVKCADSGDYYLILRKEHPAPVVTYGKLTVRKYDLPRPLPRIVTKILTPTVVGIGNGVTFQCSFNTINLNYTYALWIVGKYTIEKSNSRFKVISNGNEFILHITAALPDMAGEVVCQLRQHLPEHDSLFICKTSSYLIVLPDVAMETKCLFEKKQVQFLTERNIFNDDNASLSMPRQIAPNRSPTINDVIVFFKFSTMGENCIFFKVGEAAAQSDVTEISVQKSPYSPTIARWIFKWKRPADGLWYTIDLCQSDGVYKPVGSSRFPIFVLKDPSEDTLLNFRVRIKKPIKNSRVRMLQFNPQNRTQKNRKISNKIQANSEFKKLYVHDKRLARGSFGVMSLVRRKRDQTAFITKTMKFTNDIQRKMRMREFDITRRLTHPNIVTIKGYSTSLRNGIIFLMENLWGNELMTRRFDSDDADETNNKSYIRQILLALRYLHSKKIAHLDLNPENIVYANRHSRMIKLVDFTAARIVNKPIILPVTYGNYKPPEVVRKEAVGTYSDMWNVGVLTYWLLTNKLPFRGLSNITLGRSITRGAYLYDEFDVRTVSDRAKVFVSSLLRRHPGNRLTAEMALRDIWMTEGPEQGRPKKVQIHGYGGMRILDRPQVAIMRWKRAILAVCATIFFVNQRNLG